MRVGAFLFSDIRKYLNIVIVCEIMDKVNKTNSRGIISLGLFMVSLNREANTP